MTDLLNQLREQIVHENAARFGYVQAGQASVAAPAPQQPVLPSEGVMPLRHQSPIGIVYGSGFWHQQCLITALHVTADLPAFTQQLVDMVANALGVPVSTVGCYRLARPAGTEGLFIDGQFADAHIIGTHAAVQALKSTCPSITQVESLLGWPADNRVETAFAPVALSEGYPAGDQQGEPERRYLSRYTRLGPPGGLYGFYTSLEEERNLTGDTLGGNSGGRFSLLADSRVLGVTVRAGPSGEQYHTIGQPLTNEMTLLAA